MIDLTQRGLLTLNVAQPIWHHFFTLAPLAIIGTREDDETFDLAPVHQLTPMGWSANYIGFVTAPSHGTFRNLVREGCFTMSFPRPAQLVETSLAAAPRLESGAKPSLEALPTFPASVVDGVLVEGAYLHMECNVHRIIDGLGENCLVIGQVVAAHVDEGSIRRPERDDGDLVGREPLLAFLAPGRYASVSETYAFPFHEGFSR